VTETTALLASKYLLHHVWPLASLPLDLYNFALSVPRLSDRNEAEVFCFPRGFGHLEGAGKRLWDEPS